MNKELIRKIEVLCTLVEERWGKEYGGSSVGIAGRLATEILNELDKPLPDVAGDENLVTGKKEDGSTKVATLACTKGNSVELITALLEGKILEKNCGEVGTYWHESRSYITTLSSYKYKEGRIVFEVKGWGSAFGSAADRVIELLTNPEKWSIELPNHERSVARDSQSENQKPENKNPFSQHLKNEKEL